MQSSSKQSEGLALDDKKPDVQERWIAPILRSCRREIRETIFVAFFINLLALATPVFVLQVYDRVVFHAGIQTLIGLSIGMVLVIGFDFVLKIARSRLSQRIALAFDVRLGRRLYEKFFSLRLIDLERRPLSYWQQIFRDIEMLRNVVAGPTGVLIVDLPFVFLNLVLIFVLSPQLGVVFMMVLPLFLALALVSARRTSKLSLKERQASSKRDVLLQELLAGRTTVKALALQENIRPLWEHRQADTISAAAERGRTTDTARSLGASLVLTNTVALTVVGALLILDQQLTMGALIATNMLSGRVVGPLSQLVGEWRTISNLREVFKRLDDFLGLAQDRVWSPITHPRPEGVLKFENVSFAYSENGPSVLDQIKGQVRPKGLCCIVGNNGSGKTTFLKIAGGLYNPAQGRVMLDGGDIQQFARSDLANWIGYLPQEMMLFSGSIRDNIAFGRPDIPDQEVISAAMAACAHQMIIDLPDGYATDIGEAGSRMSGGQRQRIALARALLGKPPIILLDEPTSSIDPGTEQQLVRNLRALSRHSTVIAVTHSLSVLAAADTIMVLERGKVAMFGPAQGVLERLRENSKQGGSVAPGAASAPATGNVGGQPPAAKSPGTKPPASKPAGTPPSSRASTAATRTKAKGPGVRKDSPPDGTTLGSQAPPA